MRRSGVPVCGAGSTQEGFGLAGAVLQVQGASRTSTLGVAQVAFAQPTLRDKIWLECEH